MLGLRTVLSSTEPALDQIRTISVSSVIFSLRETYNLILNTNHGGSASGSGVVCLVRSKGSSRSTDDATVCHVLLLGFLFFLFCWVLFLFFRFFSLAVAASLKADRDRALGPPLNGHVHARSRFAAVEESAPGGNNRYGNTRHTIATEGC